MKMVKVMAALLVESATQLEQWGNGVSRSTRELIAAVQNRATQNLHVDGERDHEVPLQLRATGGGNQVS